MATYQSNSGGTAAESIPPVTYGNNGVRTGMRTEMRTILVKESQNAHYGVK